MMSNEEEPATSNLNGKRIRRQITALKPQEIGVVGKAEEKVREENPILILGQSLDPKEEVRKGQDSTICPIIA